MTDSPDNSDSPKVAAAPTGSARPVDLEFLGRHGHISVQDAQNMHSIMMRHHGIDDPDEIVADWNRRDPAAPWGSGKVGDYVRELTDLTCLFMADKIEEARKGQNAKIQP